MPDEAPQDLHHHHDHDDDHQTTQTEQFRWGGCADNLQHGLQFSRAFELTRAASANKRRKVSRRALINQHNSDVGRQVTLLL